MKTIKIMRFDGSIEDISRDEAEKEYPEIIVPLDYFLDKHLHNGDETKFVYGRYLFSWSVKDKFKGESLTWAPVSQAEDKELDVIVNEYAQRIIMNYHLEQESEPFDRLKLTVQIVPKCKGCKNPRRITFSLPKR